MLDELELRRQDFVAGPSIRLADGQWWTFPAPALRDASETAVPGQASSFGPEYAATAVAVAEAEDESERLRAELALAICLLERNYDLSPDALFRLLGSRPGDPALATMQASFRRLAQEHVCPSWASVKTVAPEHKSLTRWALARIARPSRRREAAAL